MNLNTKKIIAFLILLLVNTVTIGNEKNTMLVPSKDEQNLMHSVLNKNLFQPVTTEYLTGEESKQRVQHTKNKLRTIVKDNPAWLEFMILADFQGKDKYNFHYDARVMMTTLLSELDKTCNGLSRLAINKKAKWYVRQKAIHLLGKGNCKSSLIELIRPLIGNSNNNFDGYSEIHKTFLKVICDRNIYEALPFIETQLLMLDTSSKNTEFDEYEENNKRRLLTIASASLGNEKVLTPIITLSYDDWSHTSIPAEEALQKLIKKIGINRAIAVLSGKEVKDSVLNGSRELIENSSNEFIRRWALETYLSAKDYEPESENNIEFLTKLLVDESWYVEELLIKQLITIGSSATSFLKKHLKDNTQPLRSRYLAAYCILKTGGDISEAMKTVEGIRIPLPSYIPEEIRDVIVKSWVPQAKPRTDFRWLIEYELLTKNNPSSAIQKAIQQNVDRKIFASGVSVIKYEENELNKTSLEIKNKINLLVSLLKNKGVNVLEVVDYAEEMGSGSSSVYLIKMEPDDIETSGNGSEKTVTKRSDWLHISTLAPYIYYSRYEETRSADGTALMGAIKNNGSRKNYAQYHDAAKKAGFTWLSDEQLTYVVQGLNIYFFGDRKPLSIKDLLFYWQD